MDEKKPTVTNLWVPILMVLALPISIVAFPGVNPVLGVLGLGVSIIGLLRIGRYFGERRGL